MAKCRGRPSERYANVLVTSKRDAPRENFRLAAADVQPDGLPDLADLRRSGSTKPTSRTPSSSSSKPVDVARGLRENEADAFGPVQSWLLARRGGGPFRSPSPPCREGRRPARNLPQRRRAGYRNFLEPPARLFGDRGRALRSTVHQELAASGASTPSLSRRAISDGQWTTAAIVAEDSDEALAALKKEGLLLPRHR